MVAAAGYPDERPPNTRTTSGYTLGRWPPTTCFLPRRLKIHDPQAAEKLKSFKSDCANYSLTTGLSEKADALQVATLLIVIGEEAREVFSTFFWVGEGWGRGQDKASLSQIRGILLAAEEHPFRKGPF